MEIVPCSRIGHLYRQSVYSFGGDKFAVIARNNVRVVEVWMSDLKDLYYAVTPGISPDIWGLVLRIVSSNSLNFSLRS